MVSNAVVGGLVAVANYCMVSVPRDCPEFWTVVAVAASFGPELLWLL